MPRPNKGIKRRRHEAAAAAAAGEEQTKETTDVSVAIVEEDETAMNTVIPRNIQTELALLRAKISEIDKRNAEAMQQNLQKELEFTKHMQVMQKKALEFTRHMQVMQKKQADSARDIQALQEKQADSARDIGGVQQKQVSTEKQLSKVIDGLVKVIFDHKKVCKDVADLRGAMLNPGQRQSDTPWYRLVHDVEENIDEIKCNIDQVKCSVDEVKSGVEEVKCGVEQANLASENLREEMAEVKDTTDTQEQKIKGLKRKLSTISNYIEGERKSNRSRLDLREAVLEALDLGDLTTEPVGGGETGN